MREIKRMLQKLLQSGMRRLRPAQMIILAFMAVILTGAILLMLPFASQNGQSCGFLTALFTATSAVCVTGLVVEVTAVQWTLFGHIVILCLIQIGGLGFMTIVSVFFFLLHRRIGLKQRMVLAQSLSLDDFDSVVSMVSFVVLITLVIEGIGALLLTLCFLRETSFLQALWWGIFHSISAFCNAGFDILGSTSMVAYVDDPAVSLILMTLIVFGGLGFFVWDDVRRNRKFGKLTIHSRLVLLVTGTLILGGAFLFAVLEWNNPNTLGGLAFGEKVLASFFQSVTLRTAGFESISQAAFTEASKALSVVLMLIGGSSGSTAGGAKTVTVFILLLAVWCGLRSRQNVVVFRRTISDGQIRDALSIVMMMVVLACSGAVALSATHGFTFLDSLYETTSALATVGTTTGLTASLNVFGRLLIICYMFFGRVGIMTIGLGFMLGNQAESRYHYAETRVLLG